MRRTSAILSTTILGFFIVFAVLLIFDRTTTVEAATVKSIPSTDLEATLDLAFMYLEENQNPDGGIRAYTESSDEFSTIKTVFALAASGRSINYLTHESGSSTIDFLKSQAISYTRDISGSIFPGRTGMYLAAASASDASNSDFGGLDLVRSLTSTYHSSTGAYSTTAKMGFASGAASTVNQLWAIIGLSSAGIDVPHSAVEYLLGLQEADGGWGYGFGGDVDTTGLVIQALQGSGNIAPTAIPIQDGLDFLRKSQDSMGSWGYIDFSTGNYVANPDSTAFAIQGIAAAGYVPVGKTWEKGRTPIEAILSFQEADGSFRGNTLSTVHAIAALCEKPLPILSTKVSVDRALSYLHAMQTDDGYWTTPFGSPASPTTDVALAFIAAGYELHSITAAGANQSIMDFLESEAAVYAGESPDTAAKLAIAVMQANEDPTNFGGIDLLDFIQTNFYDPEAGAFGTITNTWHQAFPILALSEANMNVPSGSVEALLALQQEDGGWKYDLGPFNTTSAADSTGLAIQSLVAAGIPVTDEPLISALLYLRSTQDPMGGWGNANSTAYALQGLIAAGENLKDWSINGHTPATALMQYQKSDGPFVYTWETGGFFAPVDDFFATRQAIPAIMGGSMLIESDLASLDSFTPVSSGPDPDRLVVDSMSTSQHNGIGITIPFGSDFDQNSNVELVYRSLESRNWITGTQLFRANGYFTATLPVRDVAYYELMTIFSDPDQVQSGIFMSPVITITLIHEPFQVFPQVIYR